MKLDQARTELLRHAGLCDDCYEGGFLGCLRPYTGIREANFHSVVEAILSVGSEMATSETVDRQTILAILELISRGRIYAIDDEGMLVRNRLISEMDRSRFKRQLSVIERLALDLLSGRQPYDTLHRYCDYVAQHGWGENFGYFLPLLAEAIESEDAGDRMQGYCEAVGLLGSKAHSLTTSLERARERDWTWFEPVDRCRAETNGYINAALIAIESTEQ